MKENKSFLVIIYGFGTLIVIRIDVLLKKNVIMITIEGIEEMRNLTLRSVGKVSAYGVDTLCKALISRYGKSERLDLDKYIISRNGAYDIFDFVSILTAFKVKYKGTTDRFDLLEYHSEMLNVLTMVHLILIYEENIEKKIK